MPLQPSCGLKLALCVGRSGSREALSICRSSSVSSTSRRIGTTVRSRSGRRSSGSGRRRTAARAIRSYSLKVTPAQHFVNWQQDPNGNWLARFVFPERTTEFSIAVDLLADMSVINPFDFFVDPVATNYPFVYPSEFDEELAPYLSKEPAGPRLTEYLAVDSAQAAEHHRLHRRAQSAAAEATSAIWSGWSRACRRRRRR